MKRKIQLKEVVGKTVEGFALSHADQKLLISFEDKTFTVIGIREEDWGNGFSIGDTEFSVYDFPEKNLIDNSIYSAKELANTKEGIQNRNETLAEIAEREIYARLKAKYDAV